jgi:hypothetical protein
MEIIAAAISSTKKKKHLSQEKSPLELITTTQTFPQKLAEESAVNCSLKNLLKKNLLSHVS